MMRRLQATTICCLLAFSSCDGGGDSFASRRVPAVPEGVLASTEARTRGRALFVEHCALCHGQRADGHGQRRSALSSPPADFTSRAWRRQASPQHTFAVIRGGVRGSSMPAWRSLGDDKVWSLVAYLLSVSEEAP